MGPATFPPTATPLPSFTPTPTFTPSPSPTLTPTDANEPPGDYRVDGFSNDYYGIVHIETGEGFYKKGWIAIYDKKSNEELIKVPSDEIYFDLHDGRIKANILDLPYGEQSLIVYDDFNFDNIKDFAVQDGLGSCYYGPSFDIYLFENGKFILNQDFTRLGHAYCGMFQVDREGQKIYTMTKSGCCWQQVSEFVVENNVPTIKKITTDDVNNWIPPYRVLTVQEWDGGKMTERTEKYLFWEDVRNYSIFAFDLANDGGKIILFYREDGVRTLNYAYVAKDGTVIYDFPPENTAQEKPAFLYLKQNTAISLRFTDHNTQYELFEEIGGNDIKNVVVGIATDGKTTLLEGDVTAIQGNLTNIERLHWDNVVVNK